MQHAVSVKVPGCCSYIGSKLRTNLLDFNLPFLQSIPGAFKIAHTVLGMICLVLIAHFTQFFHPLNGNSLGLLCSKSAAYFLLVSYGFFVTSIILLICSVLSYFTASFLPKTAFELTYHVVACIMYLSASLILLCEVVSSNAESDDFKEPGYEGKIAASALGLVNSVLYGVSSFFSFQARKQMG
ncbi:MARVEL domain-containing protein [Trichonephila clavata]|uniref:MARVEL domain-containing protein n=1 Tax=Trichonephila clavata TaxID=2740835 RepID=A0A8X6FQ85_TRICU|nr:MARVEL domain-containing protein [Trichonephila clavata]